MPIYEYLCDGCGHEQEAIQKFSDLPLSDCEACGAPRLRRKISAAGFRLKGGGWYETDFKSSNKRNVAGDNGSGTSDSGSSSGSAKESGGSGESKSTSKDSASTSKAAASS